MKIFKHRIENTSNRSTLRPNKIDYRLMRNPKIKVNKKNWMNAIKELRWNQVMTRIINMKTIM